MTHPTFGQIVKERRMALGLTQAELARRVGCATVTVRKVEYDAFRPSLQIIERLAFALNIPETEQLAFVQLGRAEHEPSPLPTPAPLPEEIGLADLSGRAVKGFELAERIGTGGFGVVYRASQPSVTRDVAIKIILPEFANHPAFIRRFEAEAQIVAQLEHPYIVPLYDYWREPNAAYLIMRLLRGGSLETALQKGPMTLTAVNNALQQFGQGLHAAHRAGIIHRDIKPANILLDDDHTAYLADFGIAKNLAQPERPQNGALIGSPAYISPEQIKDEPIKPQTDIYSLGIMLYELLTGHKPYRGPTPVMLIQQHLSEALPSVREYCAELPVSLDTVIAQATAKNPAERFGDVLSLMAAFAAVAEPVPALALDHFPMLTDEELAELENPYKGLRPFTEADALHFYGRDNLIHDLISRLDDDSTGLSRFLAVVGPSGSGKSSVVKAGLMPALRRGGLPHSDEWFIVDMMPGSQPFAELANALLRVAVNPPPNLAERLQADANGLTQIANRILPVGDETELLLVIDQFEELFTLVADEVVREQFLDMLVTAVADPHSRIRIIITLRADFIDQPLQYVDFGELVRQRTEFVLPLSAEELEQAIVLPVENMGLAVEPGLLASLIQEVGDQPGALPLLQYTLTELFERRDGRFLTLNAYHDMGGITGALGRRAEDIYAHLNADEQAVAHQLFLRLVTLGEGTSDGLPSPDTRRRVPLAELEALWINRTPLSVNGNPITHYQLPITDYGRYRLLTFDRDPSSRGPTVEVAHEALLREWGRLRGWLDDNRDDIRQQRLLAAEMQQWLTANRDNSYLLHGKRLLRFEEWASQSNLALTADEQNYLQASLEARAAQARAEQERQQRELVTAQKLAQSERERADEQTQSASKLRRRAVYLAVFLLLALLAAGAAAVFAGESAKNLSQSEKLRLAAEASGQLSEGGMGELSALLALRSLQAGYSVEADEALMQAMSRGFAAAHLTNRGAVSDLAFSADGRYLATADTWDNSIRIWDSQTGEVERLRVPTIVHAVAFSGDGNYLLAGSGSDRAFLVNRDTGEVEKSWSVNAYVSSITISPDGKYALFSTFGAELWDIAARRRVQMFMPEGIGFPDGFVLNGAFSPDGQTVATAGYDGLIRLWDVATGVELEQFAGHESQVAAVAYSPDGQQLVSTSIDGTAQLWDVATGEVVYQVDIGEPVTFNFPTNFDAATRLDQLFDGRGDVFFMPDGVTFVTSSMSNRHVQLWDAVDGQLLRSWQNVGGDAGALSPDGRFLAASNSQDVTIWQPNDTPMPVTMYGHEAGVIDVAFAPDNQSVVSGAWDNQAMVWAVPSGQRLGVLPPSGANPVVYAVAFAPEPETVWVNLGMTIWQWSYGEDRAKSLYTGDFWEGGYGFSADGRYILYPPQAPQWGLLRDGTTGDIVQMFDWDDVYTDRDNRWFTAVSPDGRYLVTKSVTNQDLHLWDVETGEVVRSFAGHTGGVFYTVFSADGRFMASASVDGTSRVWDVATGEEVQKFVMPTGWVYNVDFAPDGQMIATAGSDSKVRLWNVTTGEQVRVLAGHEGMVTAVAFSPDGTMIVTGGNDQTVRLWPVDLDEAVQLACQQLPRDFTSEERVQFNIGDDTPTCPAVPGD